MSEHSSPNSSAERAPVKVTGGEGGEGPTKIPPTLKAVVTVGVLASVL